MARLATQIIVIVIGEGCSGGALGIGVGDVIGMLEHSYYSVISPEGCASILWKDAAKNAEAAATLKMQAENLLELGIIDVILGEPLGGAHRDPAAMYKSVQKFISEQLTALRRYSIEALLEQRYHKFRSMGQVLSHDQEIHS
jgi:acetyl-CoA carboxylase carboxyl transferase subunit alpha